jgi:sugar phosphate isomerase/epimerase
MTPFDPSPCSRRDFLVASAVAATGVTASTFAAESTPASPELLCFIKPLQGYSFDRIADVVAEAGWNGIECAVRDKDGTIPPARVEEDLPKLQETLRRRGLTIPVLATEIDDASNPVTRMVLRTASRLGITRYRVKHWSYDLKKPIAPQLEAFKKRVAALASLNKELKIHGSIQNHSGASYVGAPVWDIWELVRDLDPQAMGIQFDIAHATLEGGLCWPVHARLMAPHFTTVSVKDFFWKKQANGKWRDEWCPLGEGMVSGEFFTWLKQSGFRGPISQHFEYKMAGEQEIIAAFKHDLGVLKKWLA